MAAVYLVLAVRRSREPQGWNRWRTARFLTGIALLVLAVTPALSPYPVGDFRGHMHQHLLDSDHGGHRWRVSAADRGVGSLVAVRQRLVTTGCGGVGVVTRDRSGMGPRLDLCPVEGPAVGVVEVSWPLLVALGVALALAARPDFEDSRPEFEEAARQLLSTPESTHSSDLKIGRFEVGRAFSTE